MTHVVNNQTNNFGIWFWRKEFLSNSYNGQTIHFTVDRLGITSWPIKSKGINASWKPLLVLYVLKKHNLVICTWKNVEASCHR